MSFDTAPEDDILVEELMPHSDIRMYRSYVEREYPTLGPAAKTQLVLQFWQGRMFSEAVKTL